MTGYFIGVATTEYASCELEDVPGLEAALGTMQTLFTAPGEAGGFGLDLEPGFGLNLSKRQFCDRVRDVLGRRSHDDLGVLYYTGHALVDDADELRLAFPETTADVVHTGLSARALADELLVGFSDPGPGRLLVILDVCYAARVGDALLTTANTIARSRRLEAPSSPTLLLAAGAHPRGLAWPQAFTDAFVESVRAQACTVPRPPGISMRQAVEDANRRLGARAAEGVEDRQQGQWSAVGTGSDLLPTPECAGPIAEDLDRASRVERVRAQAEALELPFRGRQDALRQVCAWMQGSADGILEISGSPGSGVSALLNRIFALSEASLHGFVLPEDRAREVVPPDGCVAGVVQAAGRGADDVLADIGNVAGAGSGSRAHLLHQLTTQRTPQIVMVDEVDRCPEVDRLVGHLRELGARHAETGLRLIVGTRRRPHRCRLDGASVDLDALPDPAAVQAVVEGRLSEPTTSPYRSVSGHGVARTAEAITGLAAGSFRAALLMADSLASRPHAVRCPPDPGLEPDLLGIVSTYLGKDLDARLGADAARARDLLRPLAHARGDGLTPAEIRAIASAMAGGNVPIVEVADVLDRAIGHLVVREIPEPTSHQRYRLYHEALAENLRQAWDSTSGPGGPSAHDAFTTALMPPGPVGRRHWGAGPCSRYARRHLPAHAVDANRIDELLLDPDFLLWVETSPMLDAVTAVKVLKPEAHAAALAYYQAAHWLRTEPRPTWRAAYLLLAAEQYQARSLAGHLSVRTDLPWRTEWASWEPQRPHRVVTRRESAVVSVAQLAVDGVAVIESTSEQGVKTFVRVDSPTMTSMPSGRAYSSPAVTLPATPSDSGLIRWAGNVIFGRLRWGPRREPRILVTGRGPRLMTDVLIDGDGWQLTIDDHGKLSLTLPDRPDLEPVTLLRPGDVGHDESLTCAVIDDRLVVLTLKDDGRLSAWETGLDRLRPGSPAIAKEYRLREMSLQDDLLGTLDALSHVQARSAVLLEATLSGRSTVVLMTGDASGVIHSFDVASREYLGSFRGHRGPVLSLALGTIDDRPFLISGGQDGTVRVWDLGAPEPQDRSDRGHDGPVRAAGCLWTGDRHAVVTGGDDGTLRAWSMEDGAACGVWPVAERAGGILAVACPDGADAEVLAVCDSGFMIRPWRLRTGSLPIGGPALTGHRGAAALEFVQRNGRQTLVTAHADGELTEWDRSGNTYLAVQSHRMRAGRDHGLQVNALAAHPGRPELTVAVGDQLVSVDLTDPARTGRVGRRAGRRGWTEQIHPLPPGSGSPTISAVAYKPDDPRCRVVGTGTTLQLIAGDAWLSPIEVLSPVNDLAFDPDHARLVIVADAGLLVLDLGSGAVDHGEA